MKWNLFIIIFILFTLFMIFQVFYYNKIFNKNNIKIQKMENFSNTLNILNNQKEYILDDKSLENLLDDYNNLKNNY